MTRFAFAWPLIFAAGILALPMVKANADTLVAPASSSVAHGISLEEFSAQSRRLLRRRPNRVQVYRRLGPNAVRVCNARYEQEYRPSGTVIVPRMNCTWRG